MKASEAFIRTKKAQTYQNTLYKQEVDDILKKIGIAADEGKFQIILGFINEIPKKILRDEFGYSVSVYSDQRDGDSTTISWKGTL